MKRFLVALLWSSLLPGVVTAAPVAPPTPPAAAIASAHPLATAAGMAMLDAGGNAFDAAIAVSAALAVVEPYGSGLGGGGFWLLHRAVDGFQVLVDGRERAPLRARRAMYLDAQGEVIADASMHGALAAAIPGVPAALAHIAQHYGRLPLQQSLMPAIRLARDGFAVDEHYRRYATLRLEALRRYPHTARIFLVDNDVPVVGYQLRQPELAQTLEAIAASQGQTFYSGVIAKQLVDGVRAGGGIWQLADLAQYRVVEREPIRTEYRGMRLVSAPPPSSGGVALAGMLQLLNQFDVVNLPPAERTHLLIETMRRIYRDRAEYLGDSDFVTVPVARLTSTEHARKLARSIQLESATPSAALQPVAPGTAQGADTTHFSILDREGNRVAATLSVNFPFGSGYVAAGTGVLLNNEMDDFSSKPGVPNSYGLVGAQANAIAPGKRPLSSMSPTFLEHERGVAILGTPGGSRIITMVLLAALAFFDGADAQAMAGLPRFHHQYLPDVVSFEPAAFDDNLQQALAQRGHVLKPLPATGPAGLSFYGNLQAVVWDRQANQVTAASDPRGIGQALIH